jgi:hypothetical protein
LQKMASSTPTSTLPRCVHLRVLRSLRTQPPFGSYGCNHGKTRHFSSSGADNSSNLGAHRWLRANATT